MLRNLREKTWENKILKLVTGLMKRWRWIAIQKMMSPLHHFKQHGSRPPTRHSLESLSSLLAQITTCQTQPNPWISFFVLFVFCLFLPQTFYVTAAEQTNLYARQKIAAKGPDPLWTETTPEEIRAYLSILIMMGIKHQPHLWCYGSTDPRFTDAWISSVMPKMRFFKLDQYFHLWDMSQTPGHDSPGYDPLYKIRPFIELILPLFKANFNPEQDLSVDKAMISYKGQFFSNSTCQQNQ